MEMLFCYQNCSSDLKSFFRSLEHFFLTVSQNNFGNKIPFFFVYKAASKFLNYPPLMNMLYYIPNTSDPIYLTECILYVVIIYVLSTVLPHMNQKIAVWS